MQSKKILKYLGLFILGVALVFGISFSSIAIYNKMEEKREERKEENRIESMTTEEKLNELLESEEATIKEVEEAYAQYLPELSIETATAYIDSLAYLTYFNISMYPSLTEDEKMYVIEACDADGMYVPDMMMNETLKKKLQTLMDARAGVYYTNGEVLISVDYRYYLDTYGEYMADDYKSIFEFYANEQKVDYIDMFEDAFICEVVLDRIFALNTCMENFKDSSLYEVFESSRNFYLKEYYGIYSPDYVYDADGKVKDYMLESYKELARGETIFAEEAKKVIEAYETSGGKKSTDVETAIFQAAHLSEEEKEEYTAEKNDKCS